MTLIQKYIFRRLICGSIGCIIIGLIFIGFSFINMRQQSTNSYECEATDKFIYSNGEPIRKETFDTNSNVSIMYSCDENRFLASNFFGRASSFDKLPKVGDKKTLYFFRYFSFNGYIHGYDDSELNSTSEIFRLGFLISGSIICGIAIIAIIITIIWNVRNGDCVRYDTSLVYPV